MDLGTHFSKSHKHGQQVATVRESSTPAQGTREKFLSCAFRLAQPYSPTLSAMLSNKSIKPLNNISKNALVPAASNSKDNNA